MTSLQAASGGRLARLRPSLETNLALLAGLITAAGLPPYPWTGVLVPFGLGLLFVLMARGAHPGRLAWAFGLALQTVVLHWLFLLIPAKSIPTRALVPVQAIATIVYVSIFYLLVGWVFGHLRRRLGPARALLLLPILWTAMEFVRGAGEMGFPWCLTGSCVVGTPLQWFVRAGGELAVGAGIALVAAAAATVRLREQLGPDGPAAARGAVLATACFWLALAGGGLLRPLAPQPRTAAVPQVAVAAIQADVDLADKWLDAKIDSTRIPYESLTGEAAAHGAQFVVWAETAVPAYLRYDKDLLNWTRRVVRDSGAWLYTGFPDAERSPDGTIRRFNSSGLFSPDGTLEDRYAKHHLLPIGEAMPFSRYLPFLAKIDVGQAEWEPGAPPQPQRVRLSDGGFDFSGLICFESVFAPLARSSVRAGSQCLVVLTNDGWFGQTAGPRQHTLLSTLRATECDVPLIRCANNGISLVADARGRVLDRLDLGRRGYVLATIEPGGGRTAYVAWGYKPLLILLLVGCGLVMNLGRVRRESDPRAGDR